MDDCFENVEQPYLRYFPPIRDKCRRMLGDAGEAQETFTRLWRHKHEISPDARAVTAWIYRTATRFALDRMGSARPVAARDTEDAPDRRDTESLAGARASLERLADRRT